MGRHSGPFEDNLVRTILKQIGMRRLRRLPWSSRLCAGALILLACYVEAPVLIWGASLQRVSQREVGPQASMPSSVMSTVFSPLLKLMRDNRILDQFYRQQIGMISHAPRPLSEADW